MKVIFFQKARVDGKRCCEAEGAHITKKLGERRPEIPE